MNEPVGAVLGCRVTWACAAAGAASAAGGGQDGDLAMYQVNCSLCESFVWTRLAWDGRVSAARGQAGGARPARAWPTRSPPRGSSRAGGRTTGCGSIRRWRGRRARRADENALSGVASREQRERERERRRHVEQADLQAAEVQTEQGHRGHHKDGERDARAWARAHRTGTFRVVVYSSKSETRSVTSSFQSPPGTSCSVLAT